MNTNMMHLEKEQKEVKLIIWDLDNTLWDGILSEGDELKLKPSIINVIKELDKRGILHSISSKNNHEDAMRKLKEFDIHEYFLYPEITWSSKSSSVHNIQKKFNFGFDTIAFIDDQKFERDEVLSEFPEVFAINASEYLSLTDHPRFNPKFITEDSANRRQMYKSDIQREFEEKEYIGAKDTFLQSLQMQFVISEANEEDLKRVEELTVRTNQLNATGITYDFEQLNQFRKSDKHKLLICELTDIYGSYGKIGLALVEENNDEWFLKLMLMSCRVISRSVGSVLLSYLLNEAKEKNKQFFADFKHTDRNRQMFITYQFAGFQIENKNNENIIFKHSLDNIPAYPDYIKLTKKLKIMSTKEKIKNFIISNLSNLTNANLNDDDNIFELGYVNSMFSMKLLLFVEREFDITIQNDDISIENFSSVNRIDALINRSTQ